MKTCKRVGFIIDGLVPSLKNCYYSKTITPLFCGWEGNSSIGKARLNPLINQPCLQRLDLRYEVYKPWQRYDAIVFLKSMNAEAFRLALQCQQRDIPTVFDLNVDYLSTPVGAYYYHGMAPTVEQNHQARSMARTCNAVIADSSLLKEIAREYNDNTVWIPDCIDDRYIHRSSKWRHSKNQPLPLLWCGEAVKLFDLLVIEDALRSFSKRFVLRIITNSISAIERIFQPWRDRLKKLLHDLNVEIVPFQSIENLLSWYDRGGIFISPRFLDSSYNVGHTEWKITLPMARGRLALCSQLQSYMDVSRFSDGQGIRICNSLDDWRNAFEELSEPSFDWDFQQESACHVVRSHYSASIVASIHGNFMKKLLD